jgi:hypothetical protein
LAGGSKVPTFGGMIGSFDAPQTGAIRAPKIEIYVQQCQTFGKIVEQHAQMVCRPGPLPRLPGTVGGVVIQRVQPCRRGRFGSIETKRPVAHHRAQRPAHRARLGLGALLALAARWALGVQQRGLFGDFPVLGRALSSAWSFAIERSTLSGS